MLKKIAAATSLPVTVDRAKERLRIETDEFDADIEALIGAATAALEAQANIVLQQSSWEFILNGWPFLGAPIDRLDWSRSGCAELFVPASPVRDITALKYLSPEGIEQTVDASNWSWERTGDGALLWVTEGYSLPALWRGYGVVRVAFDAGYDDPAGGSGTGDDPELVLPAQAEMAVLFLVGHWYRTREAVSTDQSYTVPQTFEYLAAQLRVYR